MKKLIITAALLAVAGAASAKEVNWNRCVDVTLPEMYYLSAAAYFCGWSDEKSNQRIKHHPRVKEMAECFMAMEDNKARMDQNAFIVHKETHYWLTLQKNGRLSTICRQMDD